MIVKLQKWGNSQGIRLPKVIIDELDISENDELDIKVEEDKILIEKVNLRKNIVDLFEGYKGGYESQVIDWDNSVGKEIW